MRNYRLFLLLFGIVSSAFAQDYRIINPARDYYYGDMNRVIHIDSVAEENGDSLYFNYTLDLLCDRGTPVLPRWFSQPVSVNAQG